MITQETENKFRELYLEKQLKIKQIDNNESVDILSWLSKVYDELGPVVFQSWIDWISDERKK